MIASRYVPVRLIGKGGMGAVYEVEHARTGERLALKVLLSGLGTSAQAIERFKREARASARIKSEYVVRVTDADVAPELDGLPFLVMELLEGMDLEQAAAASPPAPQTVLAWLRQVAQVIDKAHRLGIIHRDLKPENLFLAAVEGHRAIVKVLDFGIAKMIEEGTAVTGAGQMLGTPKYMSPEQASPNAPVTPATDRLALGLIAYRLLVGESYYQGGALSILGQILHEDLRPPSACGSCLGGRFDAWFMKACHRNPEHRFVTATDQIEALAGALGLPHVGDGDATLPGAALRSPALATERSPSRRPIAIGLMVAAGFAAVLLASVRHYRRGAGSSSGATPTVSLPPASAPRPVPRPLEPAPSPLSPLLPSAATESRVAAAAGSPPTMFARGTRKQPRASRPHAGDVPSVPGLAPAAEKASADAPDPYAEQKWKRWP